VYVIFILFNNFSFDTRFGSHAPVADWINFFNMKNNGRIKKFKTRVINSINNLNNMKKNITTINKLKK